MWEQQIVGNQNSLIGKVRYSYYQGCGGENLGFGDRLSPASNADAEMKLIDTIVYEHINYQKSEC